MKRIPIIAIFALGCFAACHGETDLDAAGRSPSNAPPREWPRNISGFFRTVKMTEEIRAACDQAISKMKAVRTVKGEGPVNTMADAQRLLWRNINIAASTPRACVEYAGWFLISRLDWAKPDDGSFKSGFAVKKGTAEIHRWE